MNKFGTVCSHSQKASPATCCGWRESTVDCLYLSGVWSNAFSRKNKPKESNAGFIELTFALVKCELGISKLLEYCFKSFVIISLCLAKNDDIIAYV